LVIFTRYYQVAMVPELRRLTANEMELIYKAPILVSILIAGADGTIDRKELREAIEFAEKKIGKASKSLSIVFREIAQDFEDKLKILLQQYPYESTQRNPLIVEELSQLNTVFKKTESTFAHEYYGTLLHISDRIANSSGGILGYNSVGSEEAQFVNLSMIKDPTATE
jgi:hypothetical protein